MENNSLQNGFYLSRLREDKGWYSYLAFFIWPFSAIIMAFKNWDKPWAKNVFWLFCVFFGFTFVIADMGGADSDRYARQFIQFAHSDSGLIDLISTFYATGSDYIDIVMPLLMFFLSRLTDNPAILFVIFGLFSGYFYSRNIWYVFERVNVRFSELLILFMFAFIMLNPIWNINAFRFHLAAQVFLFGTLPYLLEGKKKGLIWSALSVLAHFTFVFPVAVLGLYILFRNRTKLYLIFFIITAFISEINLEWVQSSFSFLPDFLFVEVMRYTNAEYVEYIGIASGELPWFITYSSLGIKLVVYTLVAFTFLYARDLLEERADLKNLLSFALLLYAFANLFSMIPSGGRFIVVANTFMFPFFIISLSTFPRLSESLIIKAVSFPFLLLFCTVSIRMGLDHFSIMAIIGNPITAVLYSDPLSLLAEIERLF